MTLDLTPAPGAAPLRQMIWAHARTEASLLLRNGEQLLLTLVIPVAVLLAGRFFGARFGMEYHAVAGSVLALAVWSSCFTAQAISTGFERRYNVLERLAATPLGKGGLMLGKALAISLVTFGQVLMLAAVAIALGWRPAGQVLLVCAVSTPLAMLAFSGLALSLAGTVRAEVALAVANLIYLAGLALGIMVPLGAFPAWSGPAVLLLPTMALGEAFREGSPAAPLILLFWACLGPAIARKVFTWTS